MWQHFCFAFCQRGKRSSETQPSCTYIVKSACSSAARPNEMAQLPNNLACKVSHISYLFGCITGRPVMHPATQMCNRATVVQPYGTYMYTEYCFSITMHVIHHIYGCIYVLTYETFCRMQIFVVGDSSTKHTIYATTKCSTLQCIRTCICNVRYDMAK